MNIRTFIITLSSNEESVKSTERALQSAKNVGYDTPIEKFVAILPNDWHNHIRPDATDYFQIYRRPDNVAACFASHYLLWKKCVELNEPILILEHDAIFKENIPEIEFDMCITLGRPSYIRPWQLVCDEPKDGVQPLVQENFLGHHAYAIKPAAAKIFCEDVESRMLCANDIWISKDIYPWLQEYNPHPVWADTQFSTIQEDWRDENDDISIIDNYKFSFPNHPAWTDGTKENKYIEKHYSHCLSSPQSFSYIDV